MILFLKIIEKWSEVSIDSWVFDRQNGSIYCIKKYVFLFLFICSVFTRGKKPKISDFILFFMKKYVFFNVFSMLD